MRFMVHKQTEGVISIIDIDYTHIRKLIILLKELYKSVYIHRGISSQLRQCSDN